MTIFLYDIPWETIGKLWGPLGITFVVFMLAVIGAARFYQKTVSDTIADARKERDYMREQRKEETKEFLTSLKYRDDKMAESFRELTSAIRDIRHR